MNDTDRATLRVEVLKLLVRSRVPEEVARDLPAIDEVVVWVLTGDVPAETEEPKRTS